MTEHAWRTSSYSGGSAETCVEVAPLADGGVLLRDTKDRGLPPLRYTAAEWSAFLKGVKDGEFDF
ncbi:DUF397 domain-containing protein [Sciscionella sediminilitoris]|uniref:DUF397 domain-containing protein n=1 Tax=Sciscionella sediminilitoris TaxID=1445613 RepID=UPI0004DFB12E|nr:DUF397 domain-containing protein [Sciscionella sp. SE31]